MNKSFIFSSLLFVSTAFSSNNLEQLQAQFDYLKQNQISNNDLLTRYKTYADHVRWVVAFDTELNQFKAKQDEKLSDGAQALIDDMNQFLAQYDIEQLAFLNRVNRFHFHTNIHYDMFHYEYKERFDEIAKELEFIQLNLPILKDSTLVMMVQADLIQRSINTFNGLHNGLNDYFEYHQIVPKK